MKCLCGEEIEDEDNIYCDNCLEYGNAEYDPDYEAYVDMVESTTER